MLIIIGLAIIIVVYLIVKNTSATARSAALANQMAFDAMTPDQQDRVIEADDERRRARNRQAVVIFILLGVAVWWIFSH